MTDLPGLSDISYGSVSFAGPRVSSSVSIRPKYDSANRTVVADVITIRVKAIITSDQSGELGPSSSSDTPDDFITALHKNLMTPGLQLTYSGWGHGTFIVNGSGSTRDIEYGPKPVSLDVKPIGGNLVFEVDWVVETAIKRCGSANALYGKIGDIKEMTYSVVYSCNDRGLLTKTTQGKIAISLNRAGTSSNQINRTADDVWERFSVAIPLRFRRTQNQRTLSEDKSELTFSIVDAELPSENAYPPGCSKMSFDHNIAFKVGGRRSSEPVFSGSIQGQIEMVRPFPLSVGWDRALLMMRERLNTMKSFGATVLISSLSVTERVFERTISFSLGYILSTVGSSLSNFVQRNAVFKKVDANDFSEWKRSMENSAWHPRGTSRLLANPGSDRIVDPCNQSNITVRDYIVGAGSSSLGGSLANERPERSKSYLMWRNWIEVSSDTRGVVHHLMKPLSSVASVARQEVSKMIDLEPGVAASSNLVVQYDGGVDVVVALVGKAMRAGYLVELPRLVKIWDKTPTILPTRMRTQQTIISDFGNVPVYLKKWIIPYRVTFRNSAELNRALGEGFVSAVVSTDDDIRGFKVLNNP